MNVLLKLKTFKGANKKAGYNKLSCCDETSASADVKNGNIKDSLVTPLQPSPTDADSSDSSSASDFELEEEDEFSDDSDHGELHTKKKKKKIHQNKSQFHFPLSLSCVIQILIGT